jgi:quinol-cytochrome oxidoreductase complex cytochrome b subunit
MRLPALMAIVYGVGIAGFETLVNWGQWQWWPWWLVDYVAGAVLLIGGLLTLKSHRAGPLWLSLGWGFALGMMWMSLAGNLEAGTDPARNARVAGLYIVLIVTSMAYCLIGLFLTLRNFSSDQSNV